MPMQFDFKNYLKAHGTGYVVKIAYFKNQEMRTQTLVAGYRQVIPDVLLMTEDCIFDIASLTKIFTSILVYKAVEQKMFRLEDYIKDIDNRFLYLDTVTVLDLLSHHNDLWTDGYLGNATSKEEFQSMLFRSKIKSLERTYVDSHYMVLSILLEKVYQLPFQEIVKKEIVEPLHLLHTSFDCEDISNVASNNYEIVNGQVVDFIFPGTVHDTKARVAKQLGVEVGHAGIFTTAGDLFTILLSFFDERYPLLKKDSIDKMLEHDDFFKEIYSLLMDFAKEENIFVAPNLDCNQIYDEIVKKIEDEKVLLSKIPSAYNYGGMRFRHLLNKKNDHPKLASNDSVLFSGYTGPIFFLDFQRKIVILVMTNVCHNSHKNRTERYQMSRQLVEELYNTVLDEMDS